MDAAGPRPTSTESVLRFGVFELDLAARELRKSGMRLRLQEQPFQVLAALVEKKGATVTREELRQQLWPADTFVDFDHGLNTAINKLRETLGDSAANPRFIETLPRKGYRFICPVISAASGAGEPVSPARESERQGPLPRVPHGLARTLFLLLQLLYLAFYVAAMANARLIPRIVEELAGLNGVWVLTVVLVTGAIGIAVRLFMISATTFDVRVFPHQFARVFPALCLLDELWALSPFLLWQKIGHGLALACTATLVWLPFAQRTLIRMRSTK